MVCGDAPYFYTSTLYIKYTSTCRLCFKSTFGVNENLEKIATIYKLTDRNATVAYHRVLMWYKKCVGNCTFKVFN